MGVDEEIFKSWMDVETMIEIVNNEGNLYYYYYKISEE